MKYSELIKEISVNCEIYRNGAKHDIWINKSTGKKFPVGRHKSQEVPKGTLLSIRKDAGLL